MDEKSTWMTVAEVADDVRLSDRGVRKLIADGHLPAHKVGKRALRIRRADVDALFRPLPTVGSDLT
jgi:excisionase family DNA binding protein